MIDRNDIERRIAEHHERVARVNETGWRREKPIRAQRPRHALAALLRALAVRLDPTYDQAPALTPANRT
jgi:hypothetical protein